MPNLSSDRSVTQAEARLAEGFCPHTEHGQLRKMNPKSDRSRMDYCSTCVGHWEADEFMPGLGCIKFRAIEVYDGIAYGFTLVLSSTELVSITLGADWLIAHSVEHAHLKVTRAVAKAKSGAA